MRIVRTDQAPLPGGHYSQAVVHAGLVFVSGLLPVDASGRRLTGEPIETQARQALANLDAVLRAAGSDRDHVVKVTVFVPDVSLWDAVNRVYADFFGDHRPARAVVPTRELHHGLLVEVEAVAAVRDEVQPAPR